jgi:hypothetical protein
MKVEAMTKAGEKTMFAEMVQSCPAGYVRDILTDMKLEVFRAIDSDFGFVPFAEFERMKQADREAMTVAQSQLSQLRDQIAKLEADVRDIERAKEYASRGLESFRLVCSNFLKWDGAK